MPGNMCFYWIVLPVSAGVGCPTLQHSLWQSDMVMPFLPRPPAVSLGWWEADTVRALNKMSLSFLQVWLPGLKVSFASAAVYSWPWVRGKPWHSLAHFSFATAFKLRLFALILAWASLQLYPCLTISVVHPDLQTWLPGLTSDQLHFYGLVWLSGL